MSEPTPSSTKCYRSDPFDIEESIVSAGGQQWLQLRLTLSQQAMIPLPNANHYLETQVEAERVVFGMLNERITAAIDEIIEADGDK